MNNQRMFLLSILLILFAMAGCSKDNEVVETENETEQTQQDRTEKPEKEQEVEEVEPTYKHVYPLTGIKTNDDISNRAVAVMVNNHPSARPQTGLTKADIVFEILAEGNITRFMALFHSEKPEVVGPVRSARPYYFQLADDYGALYVYHGAAVFIENMLRAGAADYLNGSYYDNDGHLFERSSDRVRPHNSYLLFDGVYKVAQNKGYSVEASHTELPFLSDEEMTTISGEDITEIDISYYNNPPVRYVYDSSREKYLRFNGDDQTVDLQTEDEILLDNVFVMETEHQVTDSKGRREIDFQSGGKALLFQKGKVLEVQWENVEGQILPVDSNGNTIGLVPGKTWINVVPASPGLDAVSMQ